MKQKLFFSVSNFGLFCFFFTVETFLAMPFGLSICAVIGDICTQSNLGEYQKRINKAFLG